MSTILDDYSRYIIAWKLSPTMGATDVEETLDQALAVTGVQSVPVRHRPRLLSDNGPAYVSSQLRDYLSEQGMTHTRGAPYHPMTQGKIERYHESLDNVTPADVYFGRQQTLLSERQRIKQQTMQQRKKEFLAAQAA